MTPRLWAVAALAALVLVAAGLVQVVLGSREQLLQLLVGTVLSLAVVAATAWWAFTTRRVWKRWLNIVIATLAAANVLLGFLEFGYRQAAGALAIVTGALAYAAATRHALRPSPPGPSPRGTPPEGLWTAGSPDPGVGLRSPTGGPGGGGSGSSTPGGGGSGSGTPGGGGRGGCCMPWVPGAGPAPGSGAGTRGAGWPCG